MTPRTAITALAVLLAAQIAFAQPLAGTRVDDTTFPSGLEGERLRAFLEAVDSHDLGRAERFYNENMSEGLKQIFTLDSFLDGYKWIASATGGLTFYSVRSYEPPRPNLTTFVCRDRYYGSWWAVIFHYGDNPTDGLADLRVVRASMPDAVASDRLTTGEFTAELDEALARVCMLGVFSGSVIVAAGNDVIFRHACGVADTLTGDSITVNTRLPVGTMEEMFTAVAVMQLAEGGVLSLDDPVREFLSGDWADNGQAGRVTVLEVAAHTSSAADSLTRSYMRDAGASLLGAVIAGASGEELDNYLAGHIFAPAGMTDTGRGEQGGMMSTAADLHRFTMGLASGALLSGESIQEMWTDHSPDGTGRGVGFALRMTPKGVVAGQDSASTGSLGSYAIYVETGYTVAVLEGRPGVAWPVDAMIRDLMTRLE